MSKAGENNTSFFPLGQGSLDNALTQQTSLNQGVINVINEQNSIDQLHTNYSITGPHFDALNASQERAKKKKGKTRNNQS